MLIRFIPAAALVVTVTYGLYHVFTHIAVILSNVTQF